MNTQLQLSMLKFSLLPASYTHDSWWVGPLSNLQVTSAQSNQHRWFLLSETLNKALKLKTYLENPWPFSLQSVILLEPKPFHSVICLLGGIALSSTLSTLVLAKQVQGVKQLLDEHRYQLILSAEQTQDLSFQAHLTQAAPMIDDVEALMPILERFGVEVLGILYSQLPKAFKDRVALKLPCQYAGFFKENAYQLPREMFEQTHALFEQLLDEANLEWRN